MKAVSEFSLDMASSIDLGMDKLKALREQTDKYREQLNFVNNGHKTAEALLKEQEKIQKQINKIQNPTRLDKVVNKFKSANNWAKSIAGNLGKAKQAMEALGKTGIGTIIAAAGQVFDKVLSAFDRYNGLMNTNRQALALNTNAGKLNALKDAEKQFGMEGISDNFLGAYKKLKDRNFSGAFLNAGFSQAELDKFSKMDGIDAGYQMTQALIKKIESAGGFDNQNAVSRYKESFESLGFDWEMLNGLSKAKDFNMLFEGADGLMGVNQRAGNSNFAERYESDQAKINEKMRRERVDKATQDKLAGLTDNILEKLADFLARLQPVMQGVLDFLKSVWDLVKPLADSVISFVAPILNSIWNGLKSFIEDLKKLGSWFGSSKEETREEAIAREAQNILNDGRGMIHPEQANLIAQANTLRVENGEDKLNSKEIGELTKAIRDYKNLKIEVALKVDKKGNITIEDTRNGTATKR